MKMQCRALDSAEPAARLCSDGAFENFTAHRTADEACDGQDNDCDGMADEGFEDLDDDAIADCVGDDLDNDGWTNDQMFARSSRMIHNTTPILTER